MDIETAELYALEMVRAGAPDASRDETQRRIAEIGERILTEGDPVATADVVSALAEFAATAFSALSRQQHVEFGDYVDSLELGVLERHRSEDECE